MIFDLFCGFHGTLLEGFWGHLEVENRLGDFMGALFSLELDFPGSTPPILEDFGHLLGRFLVTLGRCVIIFCNFEALRASF